MPDALPAVPQPAVPQPDAAAQPAPAPAYVPLPLRSHTILGVCEAIGEDFGFKPVYLRLALSPLVLWNFAAAVAIYLALGLAVALSRLLFPVARRSAPNIVAEPVAPVADNEELAAARLAA